MPSLPSSYILIPAVGITGAIVYGYHTFLNEAPLTKRKRLIATNPRFERQIGDAQYQSLLQHYRGAILPPDHHASIMVQRVGSRISEAANQFSKEHLPETEWRRRGSSSPYQFTVIRSGAANAFVLPNRHVFVFAGLFLYIRDEDELAAVLGHEMEHDLARHYGEMMSGGILRSIASNVIWLMDPTGGALVYSLLMPAAKYLHKLPHSREAEMEADRIGLHLVAEACYDPKAVKRIFSAVAQDENNHEIMPPEFLSTHPSNESRIFNLEKWMPEAQERFDGKGCRQVREAMEMAIRRSTDENLGRSSEGNGEFLFQKFWD